MRQFYQSLYALLALPAMALLKSDQEQLHAMIRQLPRTPRRARRLPNPPHANLSWRHPDFGCPPAEHAQRKAARAKVIGGQPGDSQSGAPGLSRRAQPSAARAST